LLPAVGVKRVEDDELGLIRREAGTMGNPEAKGEGWLWREIPRVHRYAIVFGGACVAEIERAGVGRPAAECFRAQRSEPCLLLTGPGVAVCRGRRRLGGRNEIAVDSAVSFVWRQF
jgi:hypothetical protein